MKYHCTGCDYIYDELKWEPEDGVEAFTFFEDLPSDYFCPFCDTHKDDFVLLSPEINIPLDIYHLTPTESAHFPTYSIENDLLTFEVEHQSDEEHFIYKISLHDADGDLIEEKKFQFWQENTWTFDIEYLDEIELRVYCSKEWIFSTGVIEV